MFNIGPFELIVLAFVGVIVLGPDRVPGLARDAARLIRSLREMATGARTQLREELGPEFADLDLRSLNPRTAITQVLLGEELAAGGNPTAAFKRAFLGDPAADAAGHPVVPAADDPQIKPVSRAVTAPAAVQPLGRNEAAPYDPDAT